VRDLAFRVRAKGSDVPDGAATIEVALAPPGRVTSGEPLGTVAPPTASASAPLPAGSFDWSWTEVRLAAAEWQRVAGAQAALPATASVAIRFKGAAGSVEIERAELTAATGFFAGSIATPSASSATKRRGWGRASAMCRKPSAT